MTRGKYAAKAANRLANLDNELLQQTIAERDALSMELDVARLKLQESERNLYSRALREGASLAAADIDEVNSKLISEQERFEEFRTMAADSLRDILIGIHDANPNAAILSVNFDQWFHKLVGGERAGRYVSEVMQKTAANHPDDADYWDNRKHRRLTSRKIKTRRARGDERYRKSDLIAKMQDSLTSDVESADDV
ncbi:MAG: hypothetical protein ABFD89_15605 [Bryobacteraceae bacterium]